MAAYDITTQIVLSEQLRRGDIILCPSDSSIQQIILEPGLYQLECWGSQGGASQNTNRVIQYTGGAGGYASGIYKISERTTLYLAAGNAGQNGVRGFNGGGKSLQKTSGAAYDYYGGGGGASHIALITSTLPSLFTNSQTSQVLLVAGGGGGASQYATGSPADSDYRSGVTYYDYYPKGQGDDAQYGGGGGGGWYAGTSCKVDNISSSSTDRKGGGGGGYINSKYLSAGKLYSGTDNIPTPYGGEEIGHSGNGFIKITVYAIFSSDEPSKTVNITEAAFTALNPGDVITCPYTGTKQSLILQPGTYQLECWGGEGGHEPYQTGSYLGGKGGYVSGILTINSPTEIFLYTGGSGLSGGRLGGFNGGGIKAFYPGGGGASDIRIKYDSLYARVIVAGGGGSTGSSQNSTSLTSTHVARGGSSDSSANSSSFTVPRITNNKGYLDRSGENASYHTTTVQDGDSYKGGFGFGGSGINKNGMIGGAGGGGWYGGLGNYSVELPGYSDTAYNGRGGGGGSNFILTEENQQYCPEDYLLDSKYFLESPLIISGENSMPSPTSSTQEKGHSGDGYIKITIYGLQGLVSKNDNQNTSNYNSSILIRHQGEWRNTQLFLKKNNEWIEFTDEPICIMTPANKQKWTLTKEVVMNHFELDPSTSSILVEGSL